jgi:hypothetical protein
MRLESTDYDLVDGASTRWPLPASELPQPPWALEDSIVAFASTCVRRNRTDFRHPFDDEYVFPNVVTSTVEMLNTTLVGLAEMRPTATRKVRRSMRCMSWDAVLTAASRVEHK